MKHLLLIFSAVTLCISVVRAQEQPLPDPSELFTDEVEVVNVEIEVIPQIDRSFYPQIDHQNRIIRVYDAETSQWREYPYPPDITSVTSATLQPSGFVIVDTQSVEFRNYTQVQTTDFLWELDPARSIYVRPISVCGHFLPPSSVEEEQWVLNDGALCHTGTQETIELLEQTPIEWQIDVSPNQDWFVLIVMMDYSQHQIFIYQRSTQVLQVVTGIERGLDNSISFVDWITDTQALFVESCPYNSCVARYYSLDLEDANSWQPYMSVDPYSDIVQPTDDGYFWTRRVVEQRTGARWTAERYACAYYVYDELGPRRYELGFECGVHTVQDQCFGLFPVQDGFLYLKFDAEVSSSSAISHFNPEDGSTHEILRSEIEALVGVSPDGRYIAFIGDDSGQIDTFRRGCDPFNEMGNWQWDSVDNARLFIFDTLNYTIIYETESFGGRGGSVYWINTEYALIVMDQATDRVPIAGSDYQTYHHPASNRVLHFDQRGLESVHTYPAYITIGDYLDTPSINAYTFENYETQIIVGLALYELQTGQLTQLFRHPELYRSNQAVLSWRENGMLRLTINEAARTITYTLRLREDATP
jgi:hypothetical protein